MNRKYDLIILDMDGTTADSDPMIVETMNQLYDLYRNGHRTPVEEIYYFSGPPIKQTLKKEFPHMDQEFLFSEFRRISDTLLDTHILPYPHMRELFLKLKDEGVKFAIATSKFRAPALYCTKVIHFEDIVDAVVAIDDVKNPKPAPDCMYKAMELIGISNKRRVLYLGDAPTDIESALSAGIDVGFADWGPRKYNLTKEPTFKFTSYLELEKYLYE